MKEKARYDLEDSKLTYATKGDTQEATFITMAAPSSRNLSETGRIRQLVTQAIRENEERQDPDAERPEPEVKTEEEDDDSGIDPGDVIHVLAASSIDLSALYLTGESLLLTRGICLVDGEERLTKPLWDQISASDAEKMIGTYIANFILA